jgi:23S rRNA (uracil1939-C5)-methyltransferase
VSGHRTPSQHGGLGLHALSIVKCVPGGDGLGFLEGKAVFVPGVLPGERVTVRIVKRRKDFDAAELVEVLEPSPHRVTPGCRYAGACGGCDWQHMSYAEQLRQKAAIVQETLQRTGGIAREVPPIEPSPSWAARNRAQIHRDAGGALGYMAARSNGVVAVESCPIVVPALDALFRDRAPAPEGLNRFTVFSDGAFLAVEGRDDARDLSVSVRGRDIAFSVGCFFQSNLAVLERLLPWVLEGLSGGTVADLYCGVGLFGSFLAERFQRIICVESSAMSLSYARKNVRGAVTELYPVSVEQWIASGAARALPGAPGARSVYPRALPGAPGARSVYPRALPGAPGALDAVIVDPPRAGLDAEVRDWLPRAAPRTLVYVSCNPVTLARDLAGLVAGGFRLDDLRLFDFYPQTSHVESVARLSFAGAAS